MPNPGVTLSLGGLGYATGQNSVTSGTTISLRDCGGNNTTNVKMSEFTNTHIASVSLADNTPNEQTFQVATVSFHGKGSRFLTRVANQQRNFYWEQAAGSSFFSFYNGVGWNQPYNDYTAWVLMGDLCLDQNGSQETARLKVYYQDNYNHHATNYQSFVYRYFYIQTL